MDTRALFLENLTKSNQGMDLVVGDLRQALKQAEAVESILILELIKDAAALMQRVQAVRVAVQQEV